MNTSLGRNASSASAKIAKEEDVFNEINKLVWTRSSLPRNTRTGNMKRFGIFCDWYTRYTISKQLGLRFSDRRGDRVLNYTCTLLSNLLIDKYLDILVDTGYKLDDRMLIVDSLSYYFMSIGLVDPKRDIRLIWFASRCHDRCFTKGFDRCFSLNSNIFFNKDILIAPLDLVSPNIDEFVSKILLKPTSTEANSVELNPSLSTPFIGAEADIVVDQQTIIEVKASSVNSIYDKNQYRIRWIIQLLIYVWLARKYKEWPISKIAIYNILEGYYEIAEITTIPESIVSKLEAAELKFDNLPSSEEET